LLLLCKCLQGLVLQILLLLPPLALQLLLVEKVLLHEKQLLLLELLRLNLPQIQILLLPFQRILRGLRISRLPPHRCTLLVNRVSRHARGVWALFACFRNVHVKPSVQRGDGA